MSLLIRAYKLIAELKDFKEEAAMLQHDLENGNQIGLKKNIQSTNSGARKEPKLQKNCDSFYLPDIIEILNLINKNIRVCTKPVQTIKQILPNLLKQQQESNL